MISINNGLQRTLKKLNEKIVEDLNGLIKKISNFESNSRDQEYNKYAYELRERISSLYNTTPHVLKSEIEDEFYVQDDIKYLLKHLKVDQIKKKPVPNGDKTKEFVDPFAPPFNEGQVIEENFGNFETHRIFFNKFSMMREHVLLVTRDFFSHFTHLTFDDIKNSILLMKVMEGVIFFNGGLNSGASQIRKHLQCIPYKSMYDKNFGIFIIIDNQENLQKINIDSFFYAEFFNFYKINKFSQVGINHLLIKYSKEFKEKLQNNINEDTIDTYSGVVMELYNIGLNYLNLNEEEELSTNYSLLLTSDWILLIPRKTPEVCLESGTLSINSIGFLMTVLLRNEKMADELKSKNILSEVFAKL